MKKGYGQAIKKQANMNETAKTFHERINRDQRWDKCLIFLFPHATHSTDHQVAESCFNFPTLITGCLDKF